MGLSHLTCRVGLVVFILGTTPLRAVDLATTNRECLRHFWVAAEQANRPVTVISFGDSMADSYRSIPFVWINQLVERFGMAGYSLNNYQNALMYSLQGGAEMIPPGPFWFTSHCRVRPGGSIQWEKQWSPGGVRCDRAGVFYVSHPQGGAFRLLLSTNTGPWAEMRIVDTVTASPEGHFAKLDLPLDFYRLRVEGISGTNYILGPQVLNRSSPGVHAVFADQGGIALSQVTNVPIAIRGPIFQELAPDLITWHMKEGSDQGTKDGLLECEQWWSAFVPQSSVLYIGTPWASVDTNGTFTVDQNLLVRSIAVAYHRAYVDCMTPGVSFPWMVAQGYMSDETHLNYAGSAYLANIAWNDLGFYALRRPRSLAVRSTGTGVTVEYPTAAGLSYVLEHSADGLAWSGVSTNAGTGAVLSTTRTSLSAAELFRLRLEP